MAREQIDSVLRLLRRELEQRTLEDHTDGQLLRLFLGARDEGAFTALVQRHAALVLSVAGRVLHDTHAAEDVFQATFLVLARKAGAVRRRQALAGWLYQVAYRLALKARVESGRRQSYEREVEIMTAAPPDHNLLRTELRLVLDEELSRLPEKYRTPLVLHYLEGKSKAETAGHLGWTEGTVSGRLDRGRRLLRIRLGRRGFALSSTVVASLLTAGAACAVPLSAELTATARAALDFARGLTTSASGSAARLAESMLGAMEAARMKFLLSVAAGVLAAWAVTAVALAGRMGGDDSPPAQVERQPQVLPKEAEKLAQASGGPPAVSEAPQPAPVQLSASGRAVDEAGKPVSGATVYLTEMAVLRERAEREQEGYTDILARTTTAADGHFDFRDVAARPMRISPSNLYQHPWVIVITAPGYGLQSHHFRTRSEHKLAFSLRPEARVQGRLLGPDGKPAAGVRVDLRELDDRPDPEARRRVSSDARLSLYWSRLPFSVTTDAEGRFTLAGLPRNYSVGLLASDPRFARKWLSCATVDAAEIERLNQAAAVPAESKLLPNGFTARLQPSGSVRGQVIDGETRRPVAGAEVVVGIYSTSTDGQGRYSLEGFAAGKHSLYVKPPEGSNDLARTVDMTIPADDPVLRQDVTLERGSVVTGRLREKETGRPLAVPYVIISYRGEGPKPAYYSTSTKADGSFRLVVPPGKGELLTFDSIPGCVPQDLMLEGRRPVSVPLEVEPGATVSGKDLAFSHGLIVRGQVLDVEGKPVAGAAFHGATAQAPSGDDGTFTLRGLTSEFNHFLVVQAARGLGAKVVVEPRQDVNSVATDIRLQPARSATARVLDEKKQPITGAAVSLQASILLAAKENMFTYRTASVYGPVHTGADGRVALPVLVVGGSYTVNVSAPGYAGAETHFHVEAGKDPEIRDVTLLANDLAIAGLVVDQDNNPLEEIEAKVIPRDSSVASSSYRSMRTGKDGRFRFGGLPKGQYRLLVTLWKPTGEGTPDGRPAHRREAGTELRVEAGRTDLRITLQVPKGGGRNGPGR